jgi:hypothetical protein
VPVPAPKPVDPSAPPAEDDHLERVAAACEKAGDFSRADIVSATTLSVDGVKHWLGVLMRKGWVEKIGYGRYRWKGRGPRR